MTPQKINIFSIWGWLWGIPGTIFSDLGVPKRSQGRYVYILFWVHVLTWILEHFYSKISRNQNMKKCVSICKYRCFVRVAMSKTLQGSLEKRNEENNDFSIKNRWKINEKVGCSTLTSKNRENCCPGTSIFSNNRFFGRFLGPRGDPKMVKNLRVRRNFCVLEVICWPFEVVHRICLHFESILDPSWAHFEIIFWYFGGLGEVVGFLGCWDVDLLSCWVVGLLDC